MRALVLISTMMMVGAASLSESAAAATKACDKTCVVIKRALAERTKGFASLKGERSTNAWKTAASVPGLTCQITDRAFECYGFFLEAKGERKLAALLSSFRKASPGWKWNNVKEPDGHTLYGGPEKDRYVALIQTIAPPPGAEINKDQYMFNFLIYVAPQPAEESVQPAPQ